MTGSSSAAADAAHAPELLASMIGRGHLDVEVAVPCDANRRPTAPFERRKANAAKRGERLGRAGQRCFECPRGERLDRRSLPA